MNLRITAWPGGKLRLPPYSSRGPYRWGADAQVLLPDLTSSPQPAEFGGETYLDLHVRDLDDPGAILGFVNRYAPLGVYDSETRSWPMFEGSPADMEEHLEAEVEQLRLVRDRFVQWAVDEELERLAAEGREQHEHWGVGQDETDNDAFETAAEFRLAAELIRDAVTAWRAVLEDLTLGECDFVAYAARILFATENASSKARSSYAIEEYLTWIFDRTLRPFHPSVRFLDRSEQDGLVSDLVVPTKDLAFRARPYSLCGLELYNHVATQAAFKTCANETCDVLFVEKADSTTTRKPRRDSKYHDDRCANQQMQRRWRRRQAAKMRVKP
jgi:hypothetical protein